MIFNHCFICDKVETEEGEIKREEADKRNLMYTSGFCGSVCHTMYLVNYTNPMGLDKMVKEFGSSIIEARKNEVMR